MTEEIKSKPLGQDDNSGYEFVKEMLGENSTAAINFDRIQKHPTEGYIIFEYLLCDEKQVVSPYTSHPRKYWNKNSSKFISLFTVANNLNAKLYLVNYAKKGTRNENEILLIKVKNMDETGITNEEVRRYTRDEFKDWFSKLNNESLEDHKALNYNLYNSMSLEQLGSIKLTKGKMSGKTLSEVYIENKGYLIWHSRSPYTYNQASYCYLKKMEDKNETC